MKPKYLSLFLVTFLCIAFAHSMSTQVYYYYDYNGNRITPASNGAYYWGSIIFLSKWHWNYTELEWFQYDKYECIWGYNIL